MSGHFFFSHVILCIILSCHIKTWSSISFHCVMSEVGSNEEVLKLGSHLNLKSLFYSITFGPSHRAT